MFDFISKIDPKFKLGFGVAALLGIVVAFIWNGNSREDYGVTKERNRMLLEIANQPIKRDTTIKHDTVTVPPQLMSGYGVVNVDSALSSTMALYDSLTALKDKSVESQLLLGKVTEERDSLLASKSASVTLKDSIGGKHEITYNFLSHLFQEQYTPSALVRELITIHESQKLPYEIKRNWSFGLSFEFHREPGFGGTVGVKPLTLGVSYFPGTQSILYRAEIAWSSGGN